MKKSLLLILLIFTAYLGVAQTATNFTCSDCDGDAHDLFADLDQGKVIVLCWVMPCAACVGPALTTYNVVGSYAATNPGKVSMYLCDDYANTSCKLLKNWASNNGLTNTIRFSDPSINMISYGSNGMPKIVVIGGSEHKVFYNINNTVNAADLQNAINSALAVADNKSEQTFASATVVYPNPTGSLADLNFNLQKPAKINIDLINIEGATVQCVFNGRLNAGANSLPVNLSQHPTGIYFLRLSDGVRTQFVKLLKEK
jgi:hypothetical protein